MKKILDITKLSYNKLILPVSWLFGMSRFHRTCTGEHISGSSGAVSID